MAELMFEAFEVGQVAIAISSVMSLFSSGRVTGLVVDSGDSMTWSTPIYEGVANMHATEKSD